MKKQEKQTDETEENSIIKKSDKFTNWVLNKTTNRYVFLILIIAFSFLIICLGIKSYYLIFDTNHYYVEPTLDQNPYLNKGIDKYIRELDIAGLLGGIVGIFISLYMTGVIEKGNLLKEKENELKAAENLINQQLTQQTVSGITNVVNKIWQKERNFAPIDNVKDVFASISNIFETAKNNGSMIYAMNHSASFGYLLGFKVHTILDYYNMNIENLKTLKNSDYYSIYEEYEIFRKRNVKKVQEEAGKKINSSLNKNPIYVTLNPDVVDSKIPYIENYLKEISENKSVQIIFYSKYNDDNVIEEVQNIKELKEIDNLYLVPLEILDKNKVSEALIDNSVVESYNIEKLKLAFLEHLLEEQKKDIKELQVAKYQVKLVNSIYYQVYLNELSLPNEEGACLFMFVNHQTISSSGRKLLAFESRKEKYVSDSFINIITSTE